MHPHGHVHQSHHGPPASLLPASLKESNDNVDATNPFVFLTTNVQDNCTTSLLSLYSQLHCAAFSVMQLSGKISIYVARRKTQNPTQACGDELSDGIGASPGLEYNEAGTTTERAPSPPGVTSKVRAKALRFRTRGSKNLQQRYSFASRVTPYGGCILRT